MPASIADLFITVSSDVTGALGGLSAVETGLGRTTTAMASTVPAGLALAGAATAIGAGFLDTVNVAAGFEQQINGIKAVMSPTEVLEFGTAIKDLALQLGQDTKYSAIEAAGAIEELIKAGVPLPDILNGGAAAALALAAATGVDVQQAAAFAATAMNTFHLSAAQLPSIMDTIANVSNGTAASVGGLQLAFAQIGPVAAGLGLDFDETATALGIFANNGLAGSDAGTSLKTMLLNLEPTTKSQISAFKELGIITKDGSNQFFDAEGNAKDLRDIFEILKTSTAGLTAEQKINLLQTAFGTDAVRAATIAAGEGAAGWDKVTESVDKMGGVVVAAAQRQQGLTGSMETLGGSVDSVKIKIGDLFLPVLTSLVQMLTTVVNGFAQLDPTIQVVIVAAVGIAGAVAGIVAAMVLLTPVITATAASFAVLTAAASPFLVPILAITAAVAALYLAWQTNFGGIRDVTAEVWTAIQPAFQNILDFINSVRDSLGPMFADARSAAEPFIDQMSQALTPILAQLPVLIRALGDGFNALRPVLDAIGQAISFLITGNMDRLVELMQGGLPQPFAAGLQLLRDVITTSIGVMGDLLGGIQRFVGYLLAGDFQGAFDSLVATFGSIKDRIQPLWNEFLLVLSNLLSSLPGWIADRAGNIWQYLLGVFSTLPGLVQPAWESIKTSLAGLMSQLPGVLVTAAGAIWQYLIGVFSTLPGLAQPVWETIKESLSGLMSQLPGVLAAAAGAIWQYLVGVFSTLPGLVNEIWPGILSSLSGLLSQLPGALVTAAGDIWQYLVGVWSTLPGLVNELWPGILSSLSGLLSQLPGALVTAAGDIWQYLVGVWSTLPGLVSELWPGMMESLGGLMGTIGGALASAAGNVWQYLIGTFSTLPGLFAEIWPGMIEGLGGLLSTLPGALAQAAGDVWGWLGTALQNVVTKLREILGPAIQAVKELFGQIPAWFGDTSGGTGAGGGGTGGFDGGGTIGTSGPAVVIQNVYISSEAEMQTFYEQMSNYINESTGRVSATITATLPSGA